MKITFPRYRPSLRIAAMASALTVALGAHAASSFPDYPLQTGSSGTVAPNIMFILDDSGSMAAWYMPDRLVTTEPTWLAYYTYVHNGVMYNPTVTYRPWMRADGTRFTGGTSITSVFTDPVALTVAPETSPNIVDTFDSWHFAPKTGATNLLDIGSYYLYAVRTVNGATRVVRAEYAAATTTNQGETGTICPAAATSPQTGQVAVGTVTWRNCAFATPTGRSEADEMINFATWYSYARTRSKVAKSGASEAFGTLGENFRVGFDTIWNRDGANRLAAPTQAGAVRRPAYPIPVGTDDGLFRGTNRAGWFDRLFAATAPSGSKTPLHGALRRAGQYYSEDGATGPWGPQAGNAQLTCRQSYTILTTDGYWNDEADFTEAGVDAGNADGTAGSAISSADGQQSYTYQPVRPFSDTYSKTLADIAMHYWKTDLRAGNNGLANNVPTSSANPAFWQHMVTFGISIGLSGTLDPNNDVRLIEAGDKNWPDPWSNGSNTGWDAESARRIDDLLHASVNGHGRFVAASNPTAFTQALQSSLAAIQRRRASGSNVTSNGPTLSTNSFIYQATYTSGEWSGDVAAFSIAGGDIAGDPAWSLSEVADADTRPFSARPVYTWSGSAGATFPTTAQSTALTRTGGNAPATGAQNAAYLKGDRSLEKARGGAFRDRTSPIGDIVNSSPFYVKQTNSIYIGANDGMLHGVNAATGAVLFSYVPAGLDFTSLASLSHPDYQHRFFVDGGIDVSTTVQGNGLNILVGSLGRGGKGVFALNVTAPTAFDGTKVLWDQTGASVDADMGYVLGSPLVRKSNSGNTVAIVSNGLESSNGTAVLFVYELSATGGILNARKLATNSVTGNGLSEPRAADIDGDGDVDYVYAGDLKGNLWKFDLTANNSSQWESAFKTGNTPVPMFTAKDASNNVQPITAAVALAREPVTNRIFVLFGTGRYISSGDLTTTATQTFYGLVDSDTEITGLSQLQQRTIASTGTDSLGRLARSFESYSALPTDKKGWYLNLGTPTAGERVVTSPVIDGRAAWFASIIPRVGSGCDADGTGYLNTIDAFTGTNPQRGGSTYSFFDVNGNGKGDDRLPNSSGNNGFISSVDTGIGMPGRVAGVGHNMYDCGSAARCSRNQTPPNGEDPRRLGWRELYKRD